MTNFELIRTDISKVFYVDENKIIDYVEATQKIIYPREVDLKRVEMIDLMRKQGSNMYHNGKILHIDMVSNKPFIHLVKSDEPRDILE